MEKTIIDIAKYCNVSTATVSRVINSPGEVKEETRIKVEKAIERFKFVPNKKAQNLAKGKANVVAFVTSFEQDGAFKNPHKFEIMSGVQKVLESHGYLMLLLQVNNNIKMVKLLYENKTVSGFIIHASSLSKELEEYILKNKVPHLVIGMFNKKCDLSWVDNNNYSCGKMAAEYLHKIKRENFIYVGGEESDNTNTFRRKGVLDYFQTKFLEVKNYKFINTHASINDGYKAIINLAKTSSLTNYNSIICANNHIAVGVLRALEDLKMKVPKEIALITFDDYPFATYTKIPLTSVSINMYQLGMNAANFLLEKIKEPNLEIRTYITLPKLIERESSMLKGDK